jgi:hypothetical protein
VAVPVDVAFAYVDNYVFVPDWLFGVTRFEPVGEQDRGQGAVFAATVPLGPWRYTFAAEVTAYRKDVVIGWTDRTGPFGTHTIRFDPLGRGRSILTVEIDCHTPAGPIGYFADKIATSFGNTAIRRTEHRLRKGIEQLHGFDPVGRIA